MIAEPRGRHAAGSGKNDVVNRNGYARGQAGTAERACSGEGLSAPAAASLLSPPPCPCHLPNPPSSPSVNSRLLGGAFRGSDREKAGARELPDPAAQPNPPAWAQERSWEPQQPAAPARRGLGGHSSSETKAAHTDVKIQEQKQSGTV